MIEKFLLVLQALVAAIDNNTVALNKMTASAGPAPAPEPAKEPTKKKADPKPTETPTPAGPTVADVRAAAQALLDANGNDGTALTELNKKYGTKRISEVPADKYAEVIAALKDLTTKAKTPADSGI